MKKYYLSDIFSIFKIRIKLIFSNKRFSGLYVFFMVFIAMALLTFSKAAEDKSSVPIGIVDNDMTKISKRIINIIDESDTVRVIEGTEKDMRSLLDEGQIYSIFVFEKGFSDKLHKLNTKELVYHTYPKDASMSKIISDIVLAPMLDDVSYMYCKNQYYNNSNKYKRIYSEEEYMAYIKEIYKTQDKTIAFDFVLNNNSNDTKELENSIVYREVILGITAIILLIVSMIIGNVYIDDARVGADKRYIISKVSVSAKIFGDYLAGIMMSLVFSLVSSGLILKELKLVNFSQIVKIILIILALECTISMLFLLLANLVRDFVAYQLIGSMIVLALGVSGAMYILGFIVSDIVVKIARLTPIGLMLSGYKKILLDQSVWTDIGIYAIYIFVMYLISFIVCSKEKYRVNI